MMSCLKINFLHLYYLRDEQIIAKIKTTVQKSKSKMINNFSFEYFVANQALTDVTDR